MSEAKRDKPCCSTHSRPRALPLLMPSVASSVLERFNTVHCALGSSSLVVARDGADLRPVVCLAWEHNTLATGSARMVSVFSVGDYEAVRWRLIDSVDGARRGNGVVRCCGAGMFICAVPGRGR